MWILINNIMENLARAVWQELFLLPPEMAPVTRIYD